jgi:multidrug efflux pump subunit AcrA (membrane-fusion protein)
MKVFVKRIGKRITHRPLLSFLLALVVLFVIIFVSNKIRSQHDVLSEIPLTEKIVSTVRVDNGQYADLSGHVEKDGVVTIVAGVSGIVHGLYVNDGQMVYAGQRIAYFSDTYSGGSSAAVGYQIAQRQAQASNETFDKTMGIIDDQRDDVKKTDDLAAEIARKQYTIQKRLAESDHEIAQLQQKQAAIMSAMYAPVSPFTGSVDHVFVSRGETVNPGDKIAAINADEQSVKISVKLSPALARSVDVTRPSVITVDSQKIEVLPQNLSRGVADEQSYVLTFTVDEQYIDLFEHNAYVPIAVAIETFTSDANKILMPLDAVRIMSDKTVLFVVEDGRAVPKEVQKGEIVGGFIFVSGDLAPGDHVIVDRNVFDGDRIMTEQ